MSDSLLPEGESTPLLGTAAITDPQAHLKTYTAGEDGSRLANAAKEFGLRNQRQPRKQVRDPRKGTTKKSNRFGKNGYYYTRVVRQFVLDPIMEDARMRAVWTSHSAQLDEDGEWYERQLYDRLNSLDERDWDSLLSFDGTDGDDDGLGGGGLGTLQEGDEEEEDDEEGEVDPHLQGAGGNLTSAMLGVIKGMVGPAILYLPHGFASAGYLVALPLMTLSTILYLYSSRCLLDAWKVENDKAAAKEVFEGIRPGSRRRALLSYPELAYRAFGPIGETMVKTGIALMQSGVCLTYLIFVPQNLHTSMALLFDLDISAEYWLIVMVGLQIPLSWIRDIRKLTPTNAMANLLILYGLLTCLGFALAEASKGDGGGPIANIVTKIRELDGFQSDWFLFIGTSVLLFEGSITLLVPLQEAVHMEEQRKQFPSVYQRVILGIILFYAVFGITCWAGFGNDVRTVLTTSLPEGILATTVQLAYSVAVILTFPLQNFPALEIATKSLVSTVKDCTGGAVSTPRNVWSSILVCLLAVVAVCTMNSLDKVVSLMGSLLGCPIAFFFPPLIHVQLAGRSRMTDGRRFGNYTVAFLGVVAMVFATITTIIAW